MNLPFKIDNEAVGKKIAEKESSSICPYCRSNAWAVMSEAALIPQWINVLPAPGLPIAVLICQKCGNVRMHALKTIEMLPDEKVEG